MIYIIHWIKPDQMFMRNTVSSGPHDSEHFLKICAYLSQETELKY